MRERENFPSPVLVWLQGCVGIGEGGRQLRRQVGQEVWEDNHCWMQFTWKPWLHLPNKWIPSLSTNSDKQIAHFAFVPASFIPVENTRFRPAINVSSASFSSVLFCSSCCTSCWFWGSGCWWLLPPAPPCRKQRMAELRTKAHMSAQRRTMRTVVVFALKSRELEYSCQK